MYFRLNILFWKSNHFHNLFQHQILTLWHKHIYGCIFVRIRYQIRRCCLNSLVHYFWQGLLRNVPLWWSVYEADLCWYYFEFLSTIIYLDISFGFKIQNYEKNCRKYYILKNSLHIMQPIYILNIFIKNLCTSTLLKYRGKFYKMSYK